MLDLEPIKTRLEAITSGPWRHKIATPNEPDLREGIYAVDDTRLLRPDACRYSDSELVAHAPTDLAALVAEVERLREAVAAHKTEYKNKPGPKPYATMADQILWEVLDD